MWQSMQLRFYQLRQFVVVGLVQVALVISFGLGLGHSSAIASSLQTYAAPLAAMTSADQQQATEQVEAGADNVFEGLDTTKRIIGKTDKRNQYIEFGRRHASDKLKAMADQVREKQQVGESLSPVEERVLEQFQHES